ncbi:PREDICTED: uncharacterized protein LOC109328145 isoform X2 [Lupinus angustifolius]|uniref:uncharacterized protein LOC109328145 isoform X2 n=1 Tax=Lupinus angustifolius TaxID=3871 RepID=UPI00092ED419|nr:PREDICTED: uncharacterized protein LOC109328145 isoform X2 [Lupinus angustifolius]
MPGTILVSVLEFMDLPLSSSTSIRVSMGKIEYKISDKGNFSFPLTSLRDDLIVKIQDDDGNEISSTGFHIRLILEKVVWEDIFPLGTGHLHLRLQFILSDEERGRIRILRQTALKKKHDELLSIDRKGAESDSRASTGNAASPFQANDEVSESPKERFQQEAVSHIQSPVGFRNDEESGVRNVVGANLDKKQQKPNISDHYEETSSTKPVTQEVNLTQSQHKGKKPENQLPAVKQLQRVTSSEELSNYLRNSEQIDVVRNNPLQSNLEKDGEKYSEKKNPQGRTLTPSNVKKMISAFEGGLPQDMRPHIKPPPIKLQPSTIGTKETSKTQLLEQHKSLNTVSEELLQEKVKSREQIKLLQDQVLPKETMQLKELSTNDILNNQTDSNSRNKSKVTHKKDIEEEKYNKELISEGSCDLHIQRDSMEDLVNKYYSLESSQVWIFPDQQRKICRTSIGKGAMDILEIQDFPKLETLEKEAYVVSETEGGKYEKIQEIGQSKTNNSNDNGNENSGGPINQVIKVAIIIGFGVLVLFTRQRNTR